MRMKAGTAPAASIRAGQRRRKHSIPAAANGPRASWNATRGLCGSVVTAVACLNLPGAFLANFPARCLRLPHSFRQAYLISRKRRSLRHAPQGISFAVPSNFRPSLYKEKMSSRRTICLHRTILRPLNAMHESTVMQDCHHAPSKLRRRTTHEQRFACHHQVRAASRNQEYDRRTKIATGDPMEYVNLGRTGLKVSRICLGCMTYGKSRHRKAFARPPCLGAERGR